MSIFSNGTLSRHKSSTASIETTHMPAIEVPKVSMHIKSLSPLERAAALEKKLEELTWELENEQIIANKLQDMPTEKKKKSFINELNLQKEVVAQRIGSLSEQVEVHRRELQEARDEAMKVTVSRKDEQLSDLTQRLEAIIAHRNQLQAQMIKREEELLAELERLEAGRYTLSKHVLTLNAQIVMMRAEKTSIEAVVQQTRNEMDDLREELKKMQSSSSSQSLSPKTPPLAPPRRPPPPLPTGESPSERAEKERQELMREKAHLVKERDEMESTLASLVEEKAALEGRLEESTEEGRALMERLSEREKTNAEIQREVAELKHLLDEKQMIFDQSKQSMEEEHSNTLRGVEERLGVVQAQCRKQNEDLQQSVSSLEQVQSQLDAALRTIEDKQGEIKLNSETIASLRSALALAAGENTSGANTAQIHELNVQISELKNQYASSEERAQSDRKRAEESLREVERVRGALREQERLVEEGKRRVEEEMQERARDGERAALARTKQVAELELMREREVAKRDRELETLRERLSSLKKANGETRTQLAAAEKQLERSRGESEALNEALMRTIQQKLELAAQVEQWEQDMSHLIKNSVAMHT